MDLSNYLLGESSSMRRLRFEIGRIATTRLAVLVEGPTGAGKELVARAVHMTSGRHGAFVAFNACAIAESLVEDTLFGHVRGAFTDARSDVPGLLLEADRGTAFLDEISGMPTSAQAKLLRAIELGEFRPVGAHRDAKSDFRVVAASNESMTRLVEAGRFRADLYERLHGVTLCVPPLVDRLEDIPRLASFLLRQIPQHGGSVDLTPEAICLLQRHDWPGNVRELRQALERAAAFSVDGRIDAEAVSEALSHSRRPTGRVPRALERERLVTALRNADWSAERAAAALGISRATLYRQMRRVGVSGVRALRSLERDLSLPSTASKSDTKLSG